MERSIQSEVFNVGLSFEKRGEFEKAIEFYRKVIDKDDKVKSHIGKCYQALGNTAGAVDWFLKMTQSDENYLFIVDAYWEGKQPKEATDWLFRILESFRNNDAENKALKLLEQYDYPDRANDFPGYHSRLSSVYVKKALILFNKNETDSIHAYRKAVELIAINGNLDGASSAIVNDYHKAVMDAENTLRAKQQEAHERYQSMLNRAEQAMRDAEQRYNRALRDAYRDYDWALLQARDEFGRARKALENLRHNIQNTVEYQEQVRRAEARMRMADEKYNHLVHHKEEFVRNEVYYERGQVAESREEYHRVVNSRERIIREYVEPYERRLEYTRNEEYMIKSLHSKIYG
jgi:tetratricopeptide (TPR) repeat protein